MTQHHPPDPRTLPDLPGWDTSVLDQPTVIDIRGHDNTGDRDTAPTVIGAVQALAAHTAGDHTRAGLWLERLAHHGVVAIVTTTGTVELRETLRGWTVIGVHGEPDPAGLAAAARHRADRLAAGRRDGAR